MPQTIRTVTVEFVRLTCLHKESAWGDDEVQLRFSREDGGALLAYLTPSKVFNMNTSSKR